MPVMCRIVVGLIGVILVLAVTACGPAAPLAASSVSAASTTQSADNVLWGRVPYCNCLATSATANVASALKAANLPVNLKELNPSDGWLYFAVTFDPQSAKLEQVSAAMKAGGAELLDGPP